MPLNTRTAPTLKYYGYEPGADKESLLPRHALIFSETKAHGLWTKDFDCFYEQYLENENGLVPMEAFLYRHLLSLSNRGLAVSIKDYAKWLHIHHNTLIAHLDRLQDAYLMYRVCRVDTQGMPHDLVFQTPLPPKQWKLRGDEILDRLKTGCTKIEKREAGHNKNWPGPDRRFSQKAITALFDGSDRQADEFTRMVLDVLFQMNYFRVTTRKDFEKGLLEQAKRKELMLDNKLYAAAFDIKKRYAPTMF